MYICTHVYHTVLPDDVLTYIIYYMWCVHVAPKLPPPKLPIATFSFCNGGMQSTEDLAYNFPKLLISPQSLEHFLHTQQKCQRTHSSLL